MVASEHEYSESIRRRNVPEHIASETDIFCNRELKMSSLKAIGFDMDYTLSRYYQEFDLLAYEGAKEKLVHTPVTRRKCWTMFTILDFFVRGLVIDKKLGNILKIDRHKYCRKAFHGFAELGSNQRKAAYQTGATMPSFTEARFVNVDTIFTLVDA
ncbi:unnamed protein product, partial [Heterosigma akashiwo]